MYDKNFRDEDCFMVSRCSCRNYPPQLRFDDEGERFYEENWEEDNRQQNYGWNSNSGKQNQNWNGNCRQNCGHNWSNNNWNGNCRQNQNNCGCRDRDEHKDDCRCRDDHKDNCQNKSNRRKICFGFFRCF